MFNAAIEMNQSPALPPLAHPAHVHTAAIPPRSEGDAYANTLAIVAHDLRGPLTNLSLLIEDMARAAGRHGDARLARSATRAERIIDQLGAGLTALVRRGRDNRDPLSVTLAPVNLVEVLDLAVSVNQPLARSRGIAFNCHAVDPCMIDGDAELLFEAFDNLVGNAVRHALPGTTVTCVIDRIETGALRASIRDEGQGFDLKDLARVFQPFMRSSRQEDDDSPSTGLGLWIARLITERHGGRISARNRQDRPGAELSITLPARASLA